jgi:hypothetical protein
VRIRSRRRGGRAPGGSGSRTPTSRIGTDRYGTERLAPVVMVARGYVRARRRSKCTGHRDAPSLRKRTELDVRHLAEAKNATGSASHAAHRRVVAGSHWVHRTPCGGAVRIDGAGVLRAPLLDWPTGGRRPTPSCRALSGSRGRPVEEAVLVDVAEVAGRSQPSTIAFT